MTATSTVSFWLDQDVLLSVCSQIVMLKVGVDAADDEKRQRVLADWLSWMTKRC